MALVDRITIEDIKGNEIVWKHFSCRIDSGEECKRDFTIKIYDQELIAKLKGLGVNVRDFPEYEYSQVKVLVSYKFKSPDVYAVFMKKDGWEQRIFTENTIGALDNLDINRADVTFTINSWNSHGKSGVSCYLDEATFYVEEGRVASKREALMREHGKKLMAPIDEEDDSDLSF